MRFRMITIPNPMPRGMHCSRYYHRGGMVAVAAVTSDAELVCELLVGTYAELEASVMTLDRLLDEIDPVPPAPALPPDEAGASTEPIVLDDLLPRGIHHCAGYQNGMVRIGAVTGAGELLSVRWVYTPDEMAVAVATLTHLLDVLDPVPLLTLVKTPPATTKRRRARKGTAASEPTPPTLQLVR